MEKFKKLNYNTIIKFCCEVSESKWKVSEKPRGSISADTTEKY